MSDEEKKKVGELKSRFDLMAAADTSYAFDDATLLRFLRGRQGDVEKAFISLIKYVKWRAEFGVDKVSAESCPNEIATNKAYVQGKSKAGQPIVYVHAGRHNKDARDMTEITKFIIYILESARKQLNNPLDKVVLVFDLSGFTLQCMDYDVVKQLITILTKYYPESLELALLVNSSSLFSGCWTVIKPWLDPVTAEKVKFVTVEGLGEFIDSKEIPQTLTQPAA
eukprot:c27635_g1_i1.p1 GENE.c27635_g1_i1~~c27635_g1_i1.p1  ORF type:complete len:234 (+),score=74.09 c27635_g1_i1:32-703(+)